MSRLDPKGRFIEILKDKSNISFPSIERNAIWAGEILKKYEQLYDKKAQQHKHEKEIFNFFYLEKNSKTNQRILRGDFFKKLDRIYSSSHFDPSKPLGINKIGKFDTIKPTDPAAVYYNRAKNGLSQRHDQLKLLFTKYARLQAKKESTAKQEECRKEIFALIEKRLIPEHLAFFNYTQKVEKEDKRLSQTGLF